MSNLHRRTIVGTAAASLLLATGRIALADLEGVRIVTGASPGSPSDALCRGVAEGLRGTSFARNAAVENKEGNGEQLAVQSIKGAATDGSVLLEVRASTLLIFPYIYEKLGYDVFEDLTPVTLACTFDFALAVGPVVPESVHTVPDFLAWCKANPDQAGFGSPSSGTVPHFIGVMLGRTAGLKLKQVSYNGTQASVRALVAGQTPAVSAPIGAFMQSADAGKVRVLGVSGKGRSRFLPDVPTYVEQGLSDMAFTEWYGFFAPGGTSTSTILDANAALRTALKRQDVVDGLAAAALEVKSSTPIELALRLRSEYDRWGPLVKAAEFTSKS